ncbi:DUF411 domain-containing protein [Gammaproteobacteria bacterium]|nr:DUF411 domain-containing protein [Gammaproteobacteria bacterium]
MNKKYLLIIICSLVMSAFAANTIDQDANTETRLLVHKTPTCGCCKAWVKHIENSGFITKVQDHKNLADIKEMFGIKPQYRSCHTAVSEDGYIFEGHIPSKYVTQFLSENHPNATGLSVPGMPLGSPGMEVGDRFMPYKVLMLYKDGSSNVYAEVNKK